MLVVIIVIITIITIRGIMITTTIKVVMLIF